VCVCKPLLLPLLLPLLMPPLLLLPLLPAYQASLLTRLGHHTK
jgi:hypothetical protein